MFAPVFRQFAEARGLSCSLLPLLLLRFVRASCKGSAQPDRSAAQPSAAARPQAYGKQALFLSVVGDASASNAALMTRLGVTEFPRFFIFKGGKVLSSWTGVNKQGFRNNLLQVVKM